MTKDHQSKPASRTVEKGRAIVLVSWDGRVRPLSSIQQDAVPDFDYVLFDYSGSPVSRLATHYAPLAIISERTECKGEIYRHFAAWLKARRSTADYVALIDDDVEMGVSDINAALQLGRHWNLDVFSPTLDPRSQWSHEFMVTRAGNEPRTVEWVEVMMPFYRTELLLEIGRHVGGNISSWGIDMYLAPTIQWLRGKTRTALLDSIVALHNRPITSGNKRFRNGMNGEEEMRLMKWKACRLARRHAGSRQNPGTALPSTLSDGLQSDLGTVLREAVRRRARGLRSTARLLVDLIPETTTRA